MPKPTHLEPGHKTTHRLIQTLPVSNPLYLPQSAHKMAYYGTRKFWAPHNVNLDLITLLYHETGPKAGLLSPTFKLAPFQTPIVLGMARASSEKPHT